MIGAFVTCTFGVNAGSVATLLTCTDADHVEPPSQTQTVTGSEI